jgi:murein DD-endopeptidase MepM/ murein hydrolase activator NlpD
MEVQFMRNYKFRNSKFASFMERRGFYIALAVCLVGIGSAAYVAVKSSVNLLTQKPDTSSYSDSTANVTSDANQANNTVSGIPANNTSSNNAPASSKTQSAVQTTEQATILYVMPIEGNIYNKFSGDTPVFSNTMKDWRVHRGVDIEVAAGTPVHAVADGVVSDVSLDDMMGQTVVIDHGDGLKSIYCNLTTGVTVKKGRKLNAGDVIGAVGNTAPAECAEKPHLHFEMTKNSIKVDPLVIMHKVS